MKENAPWLDRTGDARAALFAEVRAQERYVAEIIFGHGVDYGIWLEVSNQGMYAIVAPALDYWSEIVAKDVERIARFGKIDAANYPARGGMGGRRQPSRAQANQEDDDPWSGEDDEFAARPGVRGRTRSREAPLIFE